MRGPSCAGTAGPGRHGGTGEGRGAADLQHRKSHPHRPAHSADVNQPLKVALQGDRGAQPARPRGAAAAAGRERPAAAALAGRTDPALPLTRRREKKRGKGNGVGSAGHRGCGNSRSGAERGARCGSASGRAAAAPAARRERPLARSAVRERGLRSGPSQAHAARCCLSAQSPTFYSATPSARRTLHCATFY